MNKQTHRYREETDSCQMGRWVGGGVKKDASSSLQRTNWQLQHSHWDVKYSHYYLKTMLVSGGYQTYQGINLYVI